MNYVEIPAWRLAIAVLLIGVAALFARGAGLRLERELGIGAVRAAVQLIAIGYALRSLFLHESPILVFAALALMTFVAAWTAARRVEHGPPAATLAPFAFVAIASGASVALVPVLALVVAPSPWYESRYLIPIGGMMLSSAMNVVALVFERLFSAAHRDAAKIEQLLALGATPAQAASAIVRDAVRGAMIPTINGLLTVGLVSLPGMMTGQIVSGTAPEQAVRYQLVIMYQLVVVAAASGFVAAIFARRLLFTKRAQLVPTRTEETSEGARRA